MKLKKSVSAVKKSNLEGLMTQIRDETDELFTEHEKNVLNNVKSAGTRARKASSNLTKLLKAYRAESVTHNK